MASALLGGGPALLGGQVLGARRHLHHSHYRLVTACCDDKEPGPQTAVREMLPEINLQRPQGPAWDGWGHRCLAVAQLLENLRGKASAGASHKGAAWQGHSPLAWKRQ